MLIKNGAVAEDRWIAIDDDGELSGEWPVIVSLARWRLRCTKKRSKKSKKSKNPRNPRYPKNPQIQEIRKIRKIQEIQELQNSKRRTNSTKLLRRNENTADPYIVYMGGLGW